MTINASDILFFNTGATVAAEIQRDDSKSLGGYCSATYAGGLVHRLENPMPGIRVDYVSPANGEGTGFLTATGTGTLTWTPPGGAVGAAVAIANGETKPIEGSDVNKFVIVSRLTAADLADQTNVIVETAFNNAMAMDNAEDGGAINYRALAILNNGTDAITDLTIWVDAGATGLAIALDVVDHNGFIRDNSHLGEDVAPVGLSFSSPTVEGSGLVVPSLAAGGLAVVWFRRTLGAGAAESVLQTAHYSFSTFAGDMLGRYRQADSTVAGYEIFRGVDGPVDFSSAWETSATLPHTTAALPVSATYKFVTRYRNAYGVLSQNLEEYEITLDGAGEIVADPPTAPQEITLRALPGFKFQIEGLYLPDEDSSPADQWLVYLSTSGNPDPGVDSPTVITMDVGDVVVQLQHTTGAYTAGQTLYILVRVRRSSDTSDSANVDFLNAAAVATLDAPWPADQLIVDSFDEDLSTIWQADASNYIEVDQTHEIMRFVVNGVNVMGIGRGRILQLEGEIKIMPRTSNATMSALIEKSGTSIIFGVGAGTIYQVAELDINGNFIVGELTEDDDYPLDGYGGGTDYYYYNSGDVAVDFAVDANQAAIAMRLARTLGVFTGGIYDSKITVANVREI